MMTKLTTELFLDLKIYTLEKDNFADLAHF